MNLLSRRILCWTALSQVSVNIAKSPISKSKNARVVDIITYVGIIELCQLFLYYHKNDLKMLKVSACYNRLKLQLHLYNGRHEWCYSPATCTSKGCTHVYAIRHAVLKCICVQSICLNWIAKEKSISCHIFFTPDSVECVEILEVDGSSHICPVSMKRHCPFAFHPAQLLNSNLKLNMNIDVYI